MSLLHFYTENIIYFVATQPENGHAYASQRGNIYLLLFHW